MTRKFRLKKIIKIGIRAIKRMKISNILGKYSRKD